MFYYAFKRAMDSIFRILKAIAIMEILWLYPASSSPKSNQLSGTTESLQTAPALHFLSTLTASATLLVSIVFRPNSVMIIHSIYIMVWIIFTYSDFTFSLENHCFVQKQSMIHCLLNNNQILHSQIHGFLAKPVLISHSSSSLTTKMHLMLREYLQLISYFVLEYVLFSSSQ